MLCMRQRLSRFRKWFIRLGFWKKLILIMVINTITILIIMNVLMIVLLSRVSTDITNLSNQEETQFIKVSNLQVGESVANRLLKGFESYSGYIREVVGAFDYFLANPDIYQSLESGVNPFNPKLTSEFNETTFAEVGVYFFSENSTFQDHPFVDVLLATSFGNLESSQIKRMSIIYKSDTAATDIFARTVPGTDDFTIPSIEDIDQRMEGLTEGYVTASGLYNDTLTKSSPRELFALRTIYKLSSGFTALIELQIYQETLEEFLKQIYYFPSTEIVFFKILNTTTKEYQLINIDTFPITLQHCFHVGIHTLDYGNGTIADAESVGINKSFLLGSNFQRADSNTTSVFRLALIVNHEQVSVPNSFLTDFLNTEGTILNYIIYGWSTVILLSTIGLSIVTGNYIFHNLQTLSTKLSEYTKNPEMMHKIVLDLKQLQARGVIKKLIDNTVTILEKIEERKKVKNTVIRPIQYPLNLSEAEFLKKNGINDEEKFELIKQEISKRMKQRSSINK